MDKLQQLERAALLEQPNTAGDWFALIDKIKAGTYKVPTPHIVRFIVAKEAYREASTVLGWTARGS